MAMQVINGAKLWCCFGMKQSDLTVLPIHRIKSGGDWAANITDGVPLVNIKPFDKCFSPMNPAVILSGNPVPCTPATIPPWVPGAVTVLEDMMPALNNTSILNCALGGKIAVIYPGQVQHLIP